MRLSVLDQSPISEGSTGAAALRNTIDLARLADRLGYHRYWVAEHHGGAMLAGPSPEALIGPIASATEHLRVGSGGVMLPHYSPFKVAETFSVLAGLFGGRIDLGIGRAAGTDPLTTRALQRDRSRAMPDDFPDQLGELLAYLDGTIPPGHPFARLVELPGPATSACRTRSRTSSTRRGRRSPPSTASASPRPSEAAPHGPSWRSGRSPRRPTTRRSGSPPARR
jgi:luciferase family oxidoreductase group 1